MKKCIQCNREISNKSKKYCSNKCQMNFQYNEWIKSWISGNKNGIRGEYQTSNYIKRYLREKSGNSCCICGWSEINKYTNEIPLEIDHIDGDYTNNNVHNLRLVCPNCHSLTKTYKGANKGSGRKSRSKYYKGDIL